MKRRDFLSSAGAVALIPVLPLPAAAAPVAPAPVHAAKVGWAALYARTHAKASPALIQKWMGVGPQQAQALMSELTRLNIIHTPVGGVAMAIDPMHSPHTVLGTRPTGAKLAKTAEDMARQLLNGEDDPQDPETEDSDETS